MDPPYPLMEEYDFRKDTLNKNLPIMLKSTTKARLLACFVLCVMSCLMSLYVCTARGAFSPAQSIIPRITITQTNTQSTTKQVRSYQQKSLRMMFGNGRARSGAFCVLGRI